MSPLVRSRCLELLAPAKTAEIGREAIRHGADAVYIGGPSFGARHNATNAIADIAALVEFAHRFHARVFVTLNTILHDAELVPARSLIRQCWDVGVDALIVQDLGLLEIDLPPIELHASTQCDIRTPAKARFLADAGFSQIVLARELTIAQIADVRAALEAETIVEHFIHGALCVAYSGQCYISHAHTGRSANRGDCSQACRLPYTLKDTEGRVVAFEKHLLSMKDNNQSGNLEALVDAGVRSFKIEGRYKEMDYVKNITGHYRRLLDEILTRRPEFSAASSGHTQLSFAPDPDKSFHRGATDYFAHGRGADIGAFDSPTYVGTPLGPVTRVGPDWFELASAEPLVEGRIHRHCEVCGDGVATHGHHGVAVGGRCNEDPRCDLRLGLARCRSCLVDDRHDRSHVLCREPVDDGSVAMTTGQAQHPLAEGRDQDCRRFGGHDAQAEALHLTAPIGATHLLTGQCFTYERDHVLDLPVRLLEGNTVPALNDHVGGGTDAERHPARRRIGQRSDGLGQTRRPPREGRDDRTAESQLRRPRSGER